MTTETKAIALKTCPECGSANFGQGDSEPVTSGGWYGDERWNWGRYAGVHMVRLTGQRCADCGHFHHVDPEWDD